MDFGQVSLIEADRAEGEIWNYEGEEAGRMNDGKGVVGRRVERLTRMRVHLHADAQFLLGQGEPKLVQPSVVEHEAAKVGLMLGVDNLGDSLGGFPGTDPKNLTFALPAATAAEVRECLGEDAARQPIRGGH
jgi:hypothetical protein